MKIEDKKIDNFANFINELALRFELQAQTGFPQEPGTKSTFFEAMHQLKADNMISLNFESISKDDIEFFKLISDKKEITINNLTPQDNKISLTTLQEGQQQVSYKTINISKGLFNLVEYTFKTQKPVRLDFQGTSSVILKVNNEGKLTAEFMTNDAAMEYALKSSIPGLRQKMDSEGIPYQEISYRDNKKQNKDNKKKHKGEG